MPRFEVFDFETILNKDNKLIPYAISWTKDSSIFYQKIPNYSAKEAAHLIISNFQTNIVYYAHNLHFDILVIIDGFFELNIEFSWIYIKNSLYSVNIITSRGKIILKCSLKILPIALNQFHLKLTSSKKLFFPFIKLNILNLSENMLTLTNNFNQIDEKYYNINLEQYLEIYSKNDCLVLKEGLIAFFKILTNLGLTNISKYNSISSMSLNLFIKKYNTIDLKLPKHIKNDIRTAYLGGRCEVFGNPLPNEKILYYDYPGMYQGCMLERIPNGPWTIDFNPTSVDKPGFYKITVASDMHIPILPWKADKLYFPNGEFTGFFWFEEIQLFLEAGGILKQIHMAYYADSYDFYLKDFIKDLIQIRERGGVYKYIGKLLINSFYGRLGLKDSIDLTIIDKSSIIDQYNLEKKIKCITADSNPKSNIAVASVITSRARIRLYKTFINIQKHQGRILYCDTDSIFAAFPISLDIENKQIGDIVFDLTNEYTKIKKAVFAAPKTYALQFNQTEILRAKGFNINVDFDTFKTAFYDEKPLILDHCYLKNDDYAFYQINVNKTLALHKYNKRFWDQTKTTTTAKTVQTIGRYPYII